jgi:hypothetical protein
VNYDACGEATSVEEVSEQQNTKADIKPEPESSEEYVKPVPLAEKVGRYMKD